MSDSKTKHFLYSLDWAYALLLLIILGYFVVPFGTMGWNTLSEPLAIPTMAKEFHFEGLSFSLNSIVYVVKQSFQPVLSLLPSVYFIWGLLFLQCIGLALVLVFATHTKGWAFYLLCAAVFILLSFGCYQSNLGYVLMGLLALLFYFLGQKSFTNLTKFALFYVLFLAYFGVEAFRHQSLSSINWLYYTVAFLVIFSCVFIFLVSHYLLAFFTWVVSARATKGRSITAEFIILSVVYLLNCLLVFFKSSKLFGSWAGMIISPMLLLAFSTLAGVFWAPKQYASWPRQKWLALGLAFLAWTTILFVKISGNDALFDFLEDMVAFMHLAVGAVFFVHLLVNFISLLNQGLAVHKVIFQPKFSPISMAHIFSIAGVAVLVLLKNSFPVFQFVAGVCGSLAVQKLPTNQTDQAAKLAVNALKWDPYYQQANVLLGAKSLNEGQLTEAKYFFSQAGQRGGSPQTWAALARVFEQTDKPLEAAFALQRGNNAFPQSLQLSTNIAWLYDKLQQRDSTYYFLSKHSKSWLPNQLAVDNLTAFGLLRNRETTPGSGTNQMAYQIVHKLPQVGFKPSADSLLNVGQFSQVFNSAVFVNSPEKIDFDTYLRQPLNQAFRTDLLYAKAHFLFNHKQKIEGLRILENLSTLGGKWGALASQNLGVLYLQEGFYERSLYHMKALNDTKSFALLEERHFAQKIDSLQLAQFTQLKSKYKAEEAVALAPLNPQVLSWAIPLFKDQKAAYQTIYQAYELLPQQAEVIKTYVNSCLKNGLYDYAFVAAHKLPAAQAAEFTKKIIETENRVKNSF